MAARNPATGSELAWRRRVEQIRPGGGSIGRSLLLDDVIAANVHRGC
jgi:hypothetical protein